MSSKFKLANKYETNATSFHILYIKLEDSDKHIHNILGALTPNADKIKLKIFELLDNKKHLSGIQEVNKSILSQINTSKMLLKEIEDQIITQEILLLSFTLINDQGYGVLSKNNISYNTLLKEIKKFRKG